MEIPRRALLKTTGTALLIGSAGCVTDEQNSTPTDSEDAGPSISSDVQSVLEMIPASVVDEPFALTIGRPTDSREHTPMLTAPVPHDWFEKSDVDLALRLDSEDSRGRGLVVLTGDIDAESLPDGEHLEDDGEYSLYQLSEYVVAVSDGTAIGHPEKETVTNVLDGAGDDETLLDAYPTIETAIRELDGYDSKRLSPGTSAPPNFPMTDDELARVGIGTKRVNDSLVRTKGVFILSDDVTLDDQEQTELKDALTEQIPPEVDEQSYEYADGVATVVFERERQSPPPEDVPRLGRSEYNPESDRMEITLSGEGSMAVDNLTLEVDGETYDPDIWADGQSEVGAGDTIYIDGDDLEPRLQVTLSYSSENASGATSTEVLRRLEFEKEYDRDARELTLTYDNGFDLNGDEVYVGLTEMTRKDGRPAPPGGPDAEIQRELQPWSGETVTQGSSATLSDIDPGQPVIVGWKGTDFRQAIYRTRVSLPAHASTNQEGEGVTVELHPRPEQQPPETTAFEVRVNGAPADKQFSDSQAIVDDGATLTLDTVEVDDTVAVYWEDVKLHQTTVVPDVELSVDFEAADGLVLSHDGGDALDPSKVLVTAFGGRPNEVRLAEKVSGEFTAGDTVTFDASEAEHVRIMYDDEPLASFERPPHPAEVSFERDGHDVTVTLDLDQSYPADTFEILVDHEPAATQWSDSQDTVTDGDSVTLTDIEYGTSVSVVVSEDGRSEHIGQTRVQPDVDLSGTFPEDGNPTLSHDGGQALDASRITVMLVGDDHDRISLDEKVSGEFTDGDTVTFDVESAQVMIVEYGDAPLEQFHRERADDQTQKPTPTPVAD